MKYKEYKDLIQLLKSYMTDEDIENINKYYAKSLEIYKDMTRLTGEDYILHSIRIAIILADLQLDVTTIGCSLIHEAITLEKATYDDIKNEFSEEDAIILNSISKLSHIKRTFVNKNEITEKYRRIIVGIAENPSSLFIKLADRLDNLKTAYVHDEDHIKELVSETEKVFIPIAHRLGIKSIKSELEDICLRIEDPVDYNNVLELVNKDKEELEKALLNMRDEIIELLNEHKINFEIVYRVKSVRGIYNKLKAGKKYNQIYDLLGLRVLVNHVEECYLVIGLIHSKYRPIQNRFKDYIANPKNNMYQSLHTTIFGSNGYIFEVQIRTHEMNEIAEHGVASHWSYKEKIDGSKTSELENKLSNFRTLIEVNDKENNLDFFKDLQNNLKIEIYIFTPKGDVIELPQGSTPIDFAYKIHSEVGNTTIGALVNGKLEKLNYELKDGDIVDLKTQKGKMPSKAWLKFVKTDTARSRIRSYFYKQEKEKSIVTGKELLSEEIRKTKYSEKELLSEDILNKFYEDSKIDSLEDLYISISSLKYTPNIITNKLIEIYDPKKDDTIDKLLKNNIVRETENGKILIAGYGDILTHLATCCNPVLGDEIVGYITKGNGVAIHRKNCKNINNSSERIIDAVWNENISDKYITNLTIYVDSSNERLMDILSIATKEDINISSITNKGTIKNEDIYDLSIKVKNKEVLIKFMNELESTNYISKVER